MLSTGVEFLTMNLPTAVLLYIVEGEATSRSCRSSKESSGENSRDEVQDRSCAMPLYSHLIRCRRYDTGRSERVIREYRCAKGLEERRKSCRAEKVSREQVAKETEWVSSY